VVVVSVSALVLGPFLIYCCERCPCSLCYYYSFAGFPLLVRSISVIVMLVFVLVFVLVVLVVFCLCFLMLLFVLLLFVVLLFVCDCCCFLRYVFVPGFCSRPRSRSAAILDLRCLRWTSCAVLRCAPTERTSTRDRICCPVR
jgi:hypothetical protein